MLTFVPKQMPSLVKPKEKDILPRKAFAFFSAEALYFSAETPFGIEIQFFSTFCNTSSKISNRFFKVWISVIASSSINNSKNGFSAPETL